MFDQILSAILAYKWLIILSSIFIVVVFLVLHFALRNFRFNNKNVILFGTLYNFDDNDAIVLSCLVTRFVFIIYLSFFNENIGIECLFPIILLSVISNILEKDYTYLFNNLLYSFAVYVLIYLLSSMKYFYAYVEHDIIVLLMIISLTLFMNLYTIFNFISSYNHLICLKEKNIKNAESLKEVKKIKWPKIKLNQN